MFLSNVTTLYCIFLHLNLIKMEGRAIKMPLLNAFLIFVLGDSV